MRDHLAPHNETHWKHALGELREILGVEFYGREGDEEEIPGKSQKEMAARRAEKMEAIGRLAGGVAHDFNNLLSVIAGNAEFLMTDLPENSPMREEIEEIKKAVRRGADLTSQLLVFGRKNIVQPQYINLNDVTSDLSKMLKRLIDASIDLAIIQQIDLKLIMADMGQMQQVILNLVLNARDAMPKGGKLVIETRSVDFDEIKKQGLFSPAESTYVRLSVVDTGIGMTQEIQKHIFEPFFTTKAGKGTGLGLATVYGIVSKWGGHIFLNSAPGVGTTFSIYFPALNMHELVAEKPKQKISNLKGSETILLAEDEDSVRRVIARSLTRSGYKILEAQNGMDAIRKAREYKNSIDLLLSDVIMPKMNGKELSDELHKTWPHIKTIFISGYPREVLSREGVLNPHVKLLQKPVEMEELVGQIRKTLNAK